MLMVDDLTLCLKSPLSVSIIDDGNCQSRFVDGHMNIVGLIMFYIMAVNKAMLLLGCSFQYGTRFLSSSHAGLGWSKSQADR